MNNFGVILAVILVIQNRNIFEKDTVFTGHFSCYTKEQLFLVTEISETVSIIESQKYNPLAPCPATRLAGVAGQAPARRAFSKGGIVPKFFHDLLFTWADVGFI